MTTQEMAERLYCSMLLEAAKLEEDAFEVNDIVRAAWMAAEAWRDAEAKRHRGEEGARCSFCGKSQSEVKGLVAAPGEAYICDECIPAAAAKLAEGSAGDAARPAK